MNGKELRSAAPPAQREITGLLRAWQQGDTSALGRLVPLVETELRRLAHVYLARTFGPHTTDDCSG
jgi:hypothetical protein